MGIETEREMALHCSLGPDELMVRHLTGTEHLGHDFEYQVMLYSENHNIKMESLLGTHASIEVRFALSEPRFFDGIVCEFSHQGADEHYAIYRAVLRPWFWLLSRNRASRIFQKQTTLDIAKKIFQERGFTDYEDSLFNGLSEREYCVQYDESEHNFISRLFEYEGIYYFFKHEQGKHTMVLADSISAHEPVPTFETLSFRQALDDKRADLGRITRWTTTKQVVPGKVTLNDYNFMKSRASLKVERADPKPHPQSDGELYFFPGHYEKEAAGTDNVTVRLEEAAAPYDLARGVTDCQGLTIGALFTLKDHPRDDQNEEYLIASTHYEIDSGEYRSGGASALRMTTHVTALQSKIQYRPARTTAIPCVPGPQVARVVGPKGQEIWTDPYGRVKVQFAWDREGKFDEESSCWMRVSQSWAGAGWGSIHLPRIGQEVLIEFIDGDLDRPIIVGRAYNDANPTPYTLSKFASRSGFKSHTLKGGNDDYNELRFDDAKSEEEILLRAQRNFTTRVRNDATTFIGRNHTHTVKKDMKVTVQEGDYSATVSKGTMLHYVPKNLYDVMAKEIVQTADDAITFAVKNVSIRIDDKSISLNVGASTEIRLDLASLTVIGPMVNLNPGSPASGPASLPARPTAEPPEKREGSFDGGGENA